jgi:para-aminobenzoate synthetase component II
MRIFLLDNYDSFTYNLYHLLSQFSDDIRVARNDEISVAEIVDIRPEFICISPGPKDPVHAGISKDVVTHFATRIPVFGVCLGMQAINEVYGGETLHAPFPVHGKTSEIYHDGTGIFHGIPSPFSAARYHSLRSKIHSPELVPLAYTHDGVVMALQHRSLPVYGVQYHPESFLSEYGSALVANILNSAHHE